MKKLLLILFVCSAIVTSCNRGEGCTDPFATNYNIDAESDDGSCIFGSIVGIWMPDSVVIYISEEEFSLTGQLVSFASESYTRPPESVGLSGNLQFTDDGVAIIQFLGNNIDTGSYIVSGSEFSHFESDGDLSAFFNYTASKNQLVLSRSMNDDDDYGSTIYTREETVYLTKQ